MPNEAVNEGELAVRGRVALGAHRDEQAIADESSATSFDVVDVLLERPSHRAHREGAASLPRHGEELQRARVEAIELRVDELPYGVGSLRSDLVQAGREPPPF